MNVVLKIKFKIMDIEQIQQEILLETEFSRLYEIQINLSRLIKNTHKQILIAKTKIEKSEAKGNLGIYQSMLEVLQHRISDLKQNDRLKKNNQGRINHNFRLAAKIVLQKATYKEIMELAIKTRAEVKEDTKELRCNKIE